MQRIKTLDAICIISSTKQINIGKFKSFYYLLKLFTNDLKFDIKQFFTFTIQFLYSDFSTGEAFLIYLPSIHIDLLPNDFQSVTIGVVVLLPF